MGSELLRARCFYLLTSLLLLIFLSPFVQYFPLGRTILGTLGTAVLVAGAVSVSRNRRLGVIALALVLPSLIRHWGAPDSEPAAVGLAAWLAFLLFMVVVTLRHVLTSGEVTLDKLCGAICVYVLLGLTFAALHAHVLLLHPDAYALNNPTTASSLVADMTYFSFVTLTTLGYGDMAPVSQIARSLCILEAMMGSLYIAILIARLVSGYRIPPAEAERER